MNFRTNVGVTLMVIFASANAASPCPSGDSMDLAGMCSHPENKFPSYGGVNTITTIRADIWLQQQQLQVQQDLLAEMKAMREAVANLKTAVENLNAASAQLKTSNEAWRANTLNATIQKVQEIPVALASNKALTDAVAARLAGDQAWLEELRRAIAK